MKINIFSGPFLCGEYFEYIVSFDADTFAGAWGFNRVKVSVSKLTGYAIKTSS
jgi:hypothetical protein